MLYRFFGRLHALALDLAGRESGQGTVEYVGLILLVGAIIAGIVAVAKGHGDKSIPDLIVSKLKSALNAVKP